MIETTAPAAPSNTQRLPTDVRTQVGLSFFAFILIGAIDGAVGVLLPSLRAFYTIDKATVGLLFLSSTFGYLVSAFSSGPLVYKLGIRNFMMVGSAMVVLAATLISFMPPFGVLMLGLFLSGFGIGLMDAGLNSHIAGLPNNTAVLNYLHAFYGIGALLGPLLATGVLDYNLGWNTVYYVWLSVSALLVIGFALVFRSYKAATQPHSESEKQGMGEKQSNVLAEALKQRVVWVAAFFLLMYVGVEVSLGSWSFSFLTEERHEAATPAGFAVSGYWLGLTLGRLVLGKVSEKIGDRRLIELCLAGVVVGVLMIWLVPVGPVMAAGLWLVGFSLGPIFPTTIAIMSGLVSARILPSAIGFMASFGSMGAALLPAAAGALAERAGLWALMPYVIGLTVLLLGLWVALQRQQHSSLATQR
jgi:fucose permease